MTDLNALFGIDPTEGFISYVNTVKPYHTKLLDVLVEYVYSENVTASVREKWNWAIEFRRPDTDTIYSCGYGYRWDASGIIAPEAVIHHSIKSATPNTAGSNSNSFLVEFGAQPKHRIAVTDKRSNELAYVARYTIVTVNPTLKQFTVTGNATSADYFISDDHIYVTDNTTAAANTKYTMLSRSFNGTNTVITVAESITLAATSTGFVNIVLPFDSIPYWPAGTTVKVTSAGTIPVPLSSSTTYHFIPSNRVGFFTLADRRYPQHFENFVDLTTLGTGVLEIERTEPFVPGDVVTVLNTAGGFNNGVYIISDVQKEGVDFRVRVLQTVHKQTPIGMAYDGKMMVNNQSYDFPSYCPLTRASDLHTFAFIHEELKFSFEFSYKNQIQAVAEEFADQNVVNIPITTQSPAENMLFGFDMHAFDGSPFDE